ncbi:ATP-dependent DNA ligase [Arthrobacter pigmenti]
MDLPVMPPVRPMLAKPVKKMPPGQLYEPKWDGFRSIIFRDGDELEIGSRNGKPMTRYFPEVVTALKENLPDRCVLDGEIVVVDPSGRGLDFEVLQQRIHPADSRVQLLSKETPASFVAFDLLAIDDEDLTGQPMDRRRARLEEILAAANHPVYITPATDDVGTAEDWFNRYEGAGLDGIISKPRELTYQQDKRVMNKIKHVRTADCVVAGYRVHKGSDDAIGSLLLGLYDDDGELSSVGVIGALSMAKRRELFEEFQPLVTNIEDHPWNWTEDVSMETTASGARSPRKSEGSRWSAGKDLSFVPLRPERVVEVRYDYMEGDRFRHTAQFVRWRPDREPESCTYKQLEQPVEFDLNEVLRRG